ncbi:MAG TPA: DUF2845 domain-containing protein [Steroidobacteraceae bacterium]|nr:DUF2845 domain-containing protein [Steroidobacteraceae bacterium]
MRPIVKVLLGCAGLVPLTTPAETLRCGAVLIQPGDDAGYVLENCGEPEAGPYDEQGQLTVLNVYPIGLRRADRWRYHRGPGLFTAIVALGDDGRVQDIQFERVRD